MKKQIAGTIISFLMIGTLCMSQTLPVMATGEEDTVSLTSGQYISGRQPLSEEQEKLYQYPDLPAVSTNALYPEKFDLREQGLVTPAKDQGVWGTCWTFGFLSAAEGNLLKEYGINTDLSERHLAWFRTQPETSGTQKGEGISTSMHPFMLGGTMFMSISTLSAWKGAVPEEEAPYDELAYDYYADCSVDESARYHSSYQLRNVNFLPNPTVMTEDGEYVYRPEATEIIKSALMETGVLDAGYYGIMNYDENYFNSETGAQYTYEYQPANHEVSIVGWDDNYSKTNFTEGFQPEGDGAWIVKNSWGADWGSGFRGDWDGDGYFYLSYYDRSLCDVNQISMIPAEYGNDYNYQYDFIGAAYFLNFNNDDGSAIQGANVYTVQGNEQVSAVSVFTPYADMTVTADIYRLDTDAASPADGEKLSTQQVFFPFTGYHVIELDEPAMLRAGEKFAVVITAMTPDGLTYISFETGTKEAVYNKTYTSVVNEGESYVFTDGKWEDMIVIKDRYEEEILEGLGQDETVGNLLIKAFTDEIPSAELTSLKVESFDSSGVNTGDVLEVSPADPAITLSADAASASFETAVQPEGGSAEIKIGDRILQPGEKISVEELQNAEITVTTSIDGGLGNTYTFTVDVQNTVPPEDNNESDTGQNGSSTGQNGTNTEPESTDSAGNTKNVPDTGDGRETAALIYITALIAGAAAACAAFKKKNT